MFGIRNHEMDTLIWLVEDHALNFTVFCLYLGLEIVLTPPTLCASLSFY